MTVNLVKSDQNLEINKIHIARPIFAWEPGLLKMIFEPHKNMPSCKKSANYLKYWANSSLFIFFLEVSEIQWGARFPIHLTTPIPTPYLSYLPHTIPTPHTYPIPTHTYKKQPIPTLYQTYFKVPIRQGVSSHTNKFLRSVEVDFFFVGVLVVLLLVGMSVGFKNAVFRHFGECVP